jgi:hypothetical protein
MFAALFIIKKNYITTKLRIIFLCVFLSAFSWMGYAQEVPGFGFFRSGFAKIKRVDHYYDLLGEPSGWLLQYHEAGFLCFVNTHPAVYQNENVTFYLDSVGFQDYFLLAMNVEKIGNCIKGRYVCKSSKITSLWPSRQPRIETGKCYSLR